MNENDEELLREQREQKEQRDDQMRLATIGIEAESFVRSPLGKHIFERIDNEVAAFTLELINTDPENKKENRRVRLEIHKREMCKDYIIEAANSGINALKDIERDEQQDY